MLVQHNLRLFGRDLGRDVVEVTPDAMDRLRDYSWPGNIRELQNVLRQALLRLRGQVLLPEFLPEFTRGADRAGSDGDGAAANRGPDLESFIRRRLANGSEGLHAETLRWVERILLPLVLEHTEGNQRQAAKILGIARQTLRSKLRELGVTVQSSVGLGEGEAI
jgi:DNA-binding NtrC family response regulator